MLQVYGEYETSFPIPKIPLIDFIGDINEVSDNVIPQKLGVKKENNNCCSDTLHPQ
jgi:hypothetical protein